MLDAAIASFLDSLSEREFDEPFKALLRADGFRDIHFVHGHAEFGKDFIAKRDGNAGEEQWVFQTKAGDVGQGDWREIRGQLDELRTNALSHPAFDPELSRRPVLVLTGRLTGNAPLAADDYNRHLADLGESQLGVWDRETLLEKIATSPGAALHGSDDGALLRILGEIDGGDCSDRTVERFSRRWVNLEPGVVESVGVLEAAVIANRLRRNQRLELACLVALCLLRGVWASTLSTSASAEIGSVGANAARGMFVVYATELWERRDEHTLSPRALINTHREVGAFVTYHVRAIRFAELMGLLTLALRDGSDDEQHRSREVEDYLASFIEAQPGAAHALSDRWATSLIPGAIALGRSRPTAVDNQLREATRWLCDHYESDAMGLASSSAQPLEEIERAVGGALEHIAHERRPDSYLATVLLDLASVLELSETYGLIHNDVQAVEAVPSMIHTRDTPGQFLITASDTQRELNVPYSAEPDGPDGWQAAAHHRDATDAFFLLRAGRAWDQLAIQSVLRDRHFVTAMRALVERTGRT
jgi:hypothetical protein